MQMQATIEADAVGRMFGKGSSAVGLHELSLVARRGQVIALLGHNGAGKTTAIRGLSTLARFDHGRAMVAGFDVATDAPKVRERIALVGQSAAVDEHLTGTQNLVLFGRLRGLDRRTARRRAAELIEQVGLTGSQDRVVGGYSGGMRRRLDVATSTVVRPQVMFVDEPTTGLDPAARRDLWHTMRSLVADGTTVLLTTQYLEEADALADHIVLLAHGRVIAQGTSDELKDELGHPLIRVRFEHPGDGNRAITALQAIDNAAELAPDRLLVSMRATGRRDLLECVRALADRDVAPAEVTLRKPSLDDVFLSLTEQHQQKVNPL